MSGLVRLPSRSTLLLAAKVALACGIAFFLGSLLPEPLDSYRYYAALGAFTVVGLVMVDSVKESVQVFGAVATGVVLALVVQALSWTNALTVALVIAVGMLVGTSRIFGVQRTWVPLAALFVLATGGADPEPMALGYLVQVPLGALVGIVVNVVIFAPLGDDDLLPATTGVLRLLSDQMRSYADVLDEQTRTDDEDLADRRADLVHDNIVELESAQARLRTATAEARRARRGNPRRRLASEGVRQAELHRADAASRCAATLLAVGVVLGQSTPALAGEGVVLRERAAEALHDAAEAFADPGSVDERPEVLERCRESARRLREEIRTVPSGGLDHVLFGSLALAIDDCLDTFARRVLEEEAADDDQAET